MRRKNILMGVSAAGMTSVLVLALTLAILPKALATQEYFAASGGEMVENATDRTVSVEVKANQNMTIYGLEGAFSLGEGGNTEYFTLSDIEYSDVFDEEDVDYDTDTGAFAWADAEGAEFDADDVIWTASYTVSDEAVVGSYNLPVILASVAFGDDNVMTDEELAAAVTITSGIFYEETSIEKTYGDDNFTNILSGAFAGGEVVYTSSDDEIADVDADTGEVEILKAGDVTITAVIEAGDGYSAMSASYDLKINKKEVTLTSVEIDGKTYDGTTTADILDIETDDDDLQYGDEGYDYTAIANFADADAGEDKTVTVTPILYADTADCYVFKQDTYTFEKAATIDPFEITDNDVSILPEEFTYSGAENKPMVNINVSLDGAADVDLVEGKDFTVTYPEDMVSAGEKTLTINGTNNFTAGFDLTYDVDKYELQSANIALSGYVFNHTGEAIEPTVTVTIGDYIVPSSEYTVRYENNINATSDAIVRVVANDDANIEGEAEKNFAIALKVLEISGIEDQSVTYTGLPVVLAGDLTVGENDEGITANDLTVYWYESIDGVINPIDEPPINAGLYAVEYRYDDGDYKGMLTVNFKIDKAPSPMPVEMTEGLIAEKDTPLGLIKDEWTEGFYWLDESKWVNEGDNIYKAIYTYNDDEDNYTTLYLDVLVRGYIEVDIDAWVDGEGGEVIAPETAIVGDELIIEFVPETNYEVKRVVVNGINLTDLVSDNKLVITTGMSDTYTTEVVVTFRRVYNVIEGDGESFEVNNDIVSFRVDADYELFAEGGEVYMDGVLVGRENYTIGKGSTIITFSADYLNALPDGEHTLMVAFNDGGVARANFVLTGTSASAAVKTPDTGFFTGAFGGVKAVGLATTITIAVLGTAVFAKKRLVRSKIDFDKK